MEHISKTLHPIMQQIFDDFIKIQKMQSPDVSPCPGEDVEIRREEWTTLECVDGEVISESVPDTWDSPGYDVMRECKTCGGDGFVID